MLLHILRLFLFIAEVVIFCPVLYLCILSFSALLETWKRARMRAIARVEPSTHFAILIPAHNEESIVSTLLTSLSELDYPAELHNIYVIADNCTDKTADIARQFKGVTVYERFNQEQRGKGYALSWIWQQLKQDQREHDAYIVLDADSVVVPLFLRAMNAELVKGAKALQACNIVLNVTESPSAALRWIALTLINHVRPLGRNGIGSTSTLTGNGMCLSRDILQRYPWQAFGIAEDYQYYLMLIRHGERVRYVPEAVARSQMPVTFEQMQTQDIRWEAPDPQRSQWQTVRQLLQAALRLRSWICLEAIAEFLTPPFSFIVASSLLAFLASLLLWSPSDMLFSVFIIAGVAYYIATALYLLHAPTAVYLALLHAPRFIVWKLWVFFVLRKKSKYTKEWIRTARIPS